MKVTLNIPADPKLEKSLTELQSLEASVQETEKKIDKYRHNLLQPIYEQRSKILKTIPKFWYIVLAQHDDFQEYIRMEDMKFIEYISNIYVTWRDDDYIFTVEFECNDGTIDTQKVDKRFWWEINKDTGVKSLKSKKVDIAWPKELDDVNPIKIKQLSKIEHRSLTNDEKKKYRVGMKSFFAFWSWTGDKPGKEFRSGEELAELLTEDVFPLAVEYYTLAAPGIGDDDDQDEISGEELDLSDDDDQERSTKKVKF